MDDLEFRELIINTSLEKMLVEPSNFKLRNGKLNSQKENY